jgi:hypothetical protein
MIVDETGFPNELKMADVIINTPQVPGFNQPGNNAGRDTKYHG